ncbi:MAG TPA: FkbM family methyltransferase [Nitrososphaeraceae archaeon]|nr:FkbM family methyltransferase [Nitrososphaeraceae archaeon]
MKETVLWLLKGSEAVTIYDKCILFIAKIIYLSSRISLRLTLGKERRAQLYNKRDLDYGMFWYQCYNILKRNNKNAFLKFKIPKHNLEFYFQNNKDDFIDVALRENNIIDEFFRPRQGDTVVDVGAHIGKYSIIASKYVGQSGQVIAIEAHPGNLEVLNRNIKLNGLTNVIALHYVVYSKETKIKLYLPGQESHYTIYNTVISSRQNAREDTFVEVNANTLDKILEQNGISDSEVNWMKIDVEGAELEVLKGASNILSNSMDIVIFLEIHNIENGKNLYEPIMDLLEKHNFKVEFEHTYDSGEKHVILHKQA